MVKIGGTSFLIKILLVLCAKKDLHQGYYRIDLRLPSNFRINSPHFTCFTAANSICVPWCPSINYFMKIRYLTKTPVPTCLNVDTGKQTFSKNIIKLTYYFHSISESIEFYCSKLNMCPWVSIHKLHYQGQISDKATSAHLQTCGQRKAFV